MMNIERELAYKYLGIVLLTVQQACMPLMARSARDRESEVFITTVNVFIMDVIKLVVCSVILIVAANGSFPKFLEQCKKALVDDPVETAKICVPSLIYTVQNNLYYVALSNLEPTTYCVAYQMKILTTALMMRFVLRRTLSSMQWLALMILVVGVVNVQLQYEPPRRIGGNLEQSPTLGFAAVFTMCFTSAFAGVYMEKVLKASDVSVWMQNVRLALFGLMISASMMLYKDYEAIRESGMLVGFDTLVVGLTLTNSVGGLLIAVVIKYADNILKAYAQSMAIVGAAAGSWLLFNFSPNLPFVLGTFLVILSIYIYSAYPNGNHTIRQKPSKPQEKEKEKEKVLLICSPPMPLGGGEKRRELRG